MDLDCDFWIDGAPRCSNSFAVTLFRLSNPDAKVVSHWHVPCFPIYMARHNKPGFLLIRKPVDSAISWAIYKMKPLEFAFDFYIDYYTLLLPHLSLFPIFSFDEVTADFPFVIRKVNTRYDTQFSPPENSEKTTRSALNSIKSTWNGANADEYRIPCPSMTREPIKQTLHEKIESTEYLKLKLKKAQNLYQTILASTNCLTY